LEIWGPPKGHYPTETDVAKTVDLTNWTQSRAKHSPGAAAELNSLSDMLKAKKGRFRP